MPFLSIQLWTISRKLEDPVATAISKFSISLMWSTQTSHSHRLSRKTKILIISNAQHISISFLVSLFPHISSTALHKIIAKKIISQNCITFYRGVKLICRKKKIPFKTAKDGPVLFYLPPVQVPSILPQLMSETRSLAHNEANKTIPKNHSVPKLLFLGESWKGKANTASASQGTQHLSGNHFTEMASTVNFIMFAVVLQVEKRSWFEQGSWSHFQERDYPRQGRLQKLEWEHLISKRKEIFLWKKVSIDNTDNIEWHKNFDLM